MPSWYPFVYDTRDEEMALHEMLAEVVDDVDAAAQRARFEELRKWIAERSGELQVADLVRGRGLELAEAAEPRGFGDAEGLMLDALEDMPTEFTIMEFIKRVSSLARQFPVDPEARARTYVHPSNFDVYRFLVENGYEPVRFEGREVVMREVAG